MIRNVRRFSRRSHVGFPRLCATDLCIHSTIRRPCTSWMYPQNVVRFARPPALKDPPEGPRGPDPGELHGHGQLRARLVFIDRTTRVDPRFPSPSVPPLHVTIPFITYIDTMVTEHRNDEPSLDLYETLGVSKHANVKDVRSPFSPRARPCVPARARINIETVQVTASHHVPSPASREHPAGAGF